jgi:hypothetical protein
VVLYADWCGARFSCGWFKKNHLVVYALVQVIFNSSKWVKSYPLSTRLGLGSR